MPKQKLRDLISELHDELDRAERVDPEAQAMLRGLGDDIERLAGDEPAAPEHHETARERVDEAVVHFQADHPRLTRVLREIADALGRLGI